MNFDYVVIGSGFGGSVAALRLAEKGYSVAIIEKGKLIYSGPVQGVRDQMSTGKVMWVRVATDPVQAVELLQARPEIAEAASVDGEIKITFTGHDVDHSVVAEVLVRGGARVLELREDEIGLEEVFLRVTRGETQ